MIIPIQNFKLFNKFKLKKTTDNSKTISPILLKKGFERLENDIYATGGISVWNEKTQRLIAKSMSKERLETLLKLFEATENNRILFCDIVRCGIFKNRLKARFACVYRIKNFTEDFEQKIFESKLDFLIRMLYQFNKYKSEIINSVR